MGHLSCMKGVQILVGLHSWNVVCYLSKHICFMIITDFLEDKKHHLHIRWKCRWCPYKSNKFCHYLQRHVVSCYQMQKNNCSPQPPVRSSSYQPCEIWAVIECIQDPCTCQRRIMWKGFFYYYLYQLIMLHKIYYVVWISVTLIQKHYTAEYYLMYCWCLRCIGDNISWVLYIIIN